LAARSRALSKRTSEVDAALEDKLVVFRDRHGRGRTRWERAALTREAAVDTRTHKSGAGSADLRRRWLVETAEHGWTPRCLVDALADARTIKRPGPRVTVDQIVGRLSVAEQPAPVTRSDEPPEQQRSERRTDADGGE